MRRYSNSLTIMGGKSLDSRSMATTVRNLVASGQLSTTIITLKEGERLDQIAGKYYGDSTLWWVIAAASGIGWGLQCPPGTVVAIPDKSQMEKL
jgi:nucleoid-associated protein YgaU